MIDWTAGYVDGIEYTYDFHRELTPALIAFSSLNRGQKFDVARSGMSYCDLGCGQGFSANLLAAANPSTDFYATDFNPAHIASARNLADEAGLKNIHFYEHAFSDFVHEPSLPDSFDIIALHGIYSWISAENRRHVIEFILRKLRPGGLVYISFNTMPGLAAAMPLQRLLADRGAGSGPIGPRIDTALAFVDVMLRSEAGYFSQNKTLSARLSTMKSMSHNYLAHEYFNRDWTPFYFEAVATELSAAKLSYVGSVNPIDHYDELSMTDEQKQLIDAEIDPIRRQGLRDFIVNEQFRTDIFVKGSLQHTPRSAAGVWLEQRFALSVSAASIPMTIKGRLEKLPLEADHYEPLLAAFSDGPLSVRELLGQKNVGKISWGEVTKALSLLVGAGHLQPCLPALGEDERAERCRAFNLAVCKRAEDSENLRFLASPVTGGGLTFDRFEQLFLLAISEGREGPSQWAQLAWRVLGPQGQRLLKDGKVLVTAEENLDELCTRAEAFKATRLQICQVLKITF